MIVTIYRMRLTFLRKRWLIWLALIVEVLLLAISYTVPTVNGAHGWISLPVGGTLQPAEYLKLIIIWFLANEFASMQREIARYDYQALIKGRWLPTAITD